MTGKSYTLRELRFGPPGRSIYGKLLLPDVLLRFHEDVFLDDVTLDEVREALGVPITMVNSDGYELLRCILGKEE